MGRQAKQEFFIADPETGKTVVYGPDTDPVPDHIVKIVGPHVFRGDDDADSVDDPVGPFDPADHTVDEVIAYLDGLDHDSEAGQAEARRVLDAERSADEPRKGIVGEPPYDPSAHTVDEVVEHLAGLPETDEGQAEKQRVLDAEKSGQARKGIVGD